MTTTRTIARTVALAAAVIVAGTLSGCSLIGDLLPAPQPQRDETTQEITESGDADVFTLKVGDCLEMQEGEQVETVPVVPCDQPHTDEVYHDFEIADGEFPGDAAVNTAAEEGCVAAFEPFVGLPYDSSELYVAWYVPTQESWEGIDDRMVSCTITDPSGPVTGTLEGAAY
ncbi:hypothetical protein BCL57_002109 [Agromyces flavus]|uniref:Septum formation n=1 Tax=Agromyces flavus TaxID=589382 RepID=A0A1H1PE06_9MICO|nr:septum formation family protein [Agromyces flavus]MCP2367950.1 hypothetical protein [Agromyces flavus]GGI47412.1 hypothetical protein GCM10010932_21000 [Agromyces flavus]SDS08849.1 Septum formation [Agromyces flavus]